MTGNQLFPYTVIPIAQSDTTIFDPPLRAITVSAPGNLVVENATGNEVTLVCPDHPGGTDAGGRYPFTFWCGEVRKVKAATTIADADMIGHAMPQITRNLPKA